MGVPTCRTTRLAPASGPACRLTAWSLAKPGAPTLRGVGQGEHRSIEALDDEVVRRLGAALAAADYTVDVVTGLLGAPAHSALLRDATVPGLRALAG